MQEISQFNDIINLLDTANKTLESRIFVPSLGNDIVAKTLNANHTKNIVKTTVEGPFSDNQFVLIMYNVLGDVLGPTIDLNTLNLYDKILILLQLRSKNIEDEYKVSFTSADSEKTIEKSISLSKHIEKIRKSLPLFENVTDETKNDDAVVYKYTLNIPSIKEEFVFENNLYQEKIAKIDANNSQQMKGLIAPMFLSHVTPFVKNITINDTFIDLTVRSVVERTAIVERLSSKAILSIIKKVDEVFGKAMQNVTKVTKTIDGITYNGNIKIDASFFIE